MPFLVEFQVKVPAGTPDAEVEQRGRAESSAAAALMDRGHLTRLGRLIPTIERRHVDE